MSRKISKLVDIWSKKLKIFQFNNQISSKPCLLDSTGELFMYFWAKLEHMGPPPAQAGAHQRIFFVKILLIGLNYAMMLPKIENSLTTTR